MLKDICKPCVLGDNEFVGLRFEKGKPRVYFPRGFRPDFADENALRKDIVRLLAALSRFGNSYDGDKNPNGNDILTFPLISYQYIIRDFLAYGYYIEKETEYKQQNKGKINWKRTIQQIKPQANNGNVVYLDFIVKTDRNKENNLITKIHEYCVYESFQKLGWLYLNNDVLPKKPAIKLNKNVFLSTLNNALSNTFNSNKRMLFQSMINIVEQANETLSKEKETTFGVNRFEYVWESLIDYVFGEANKELFFPHAKWHIVTRQGYEEQSSALEPDTVIKWDNKLFIIDAKYYKYGITGRAGDLPATSSIQKQITYGDYAFENFDYSKNEIYNAFVMPFDKSVYNDDNYKFVSVGTADWERYGAETPNHKYVLGILMDTRYIIETYSRYNKSEIEALTDLIVESLAEYRKTEQNLF